MKKKEEKDYVTEEVAKLLINFNYDGFCDKFYTEKIPGTEREEFDEELYMNVTVTSIIRYPRPMLYNALKWLREKYNLHIKIDFDDSQLWGWSIYNIKDGKSQLEDTMSMFNSYEEALNDGIKQSLKLISKWL